MTEANRRIAELLGVTPESFAYPCGQTFVGRGTNTQSYVPVAAKLFVTARGWLDEAPNDPAYVDFAQLTGIESDGKDFEDVLPIIEGAAKTGMWVVLAGHDMRASGSQTTRLAMLERSVPTCRTRPMVSGWRRSARSRVTCATTAPGQTSPPRTPASLVSTDLIRPRHRGTWRWFCTVGAYGDFSRCRAGVCVR